MDVQWIVCYTHKAIATTKSGPATTRTGCSKHVAKMSDANDAFPLLRTTGLALWWQSPPQLTREKIDQRARPAAASLPTRRNHPPPAVPAKVQVTSLNRHGRAAGAEQTTGQDSCSTSLSLWPPEPVEMTHVACQPLHEHVGKTLRALSCLPCASRGWTGGVYLWKNRFT